MAESLREQIATDLLGYHVGTPLDSYGTSKRPQPKWCNESNCKKYKEDCEYCITDQILSLIIERVEEIENPFTEVHTSSYDTIGWRVNDQSIYGEKAELVKKGYDLAIQAVIKELEKWK